MDKSLANVERMRYRLEEVENGWILTISIVTGSVEGKVICRQVYQSMEDALKGIAEDWDNAVMEG